MPAPGGRLEERTVGEAVMVLALFLAMPVLILCALLFSGD